MSRVYLPKPTIDKHRAVWVVALLLAVFLLMLSAGYVRLQALEARLDERFFRMHYPSSTLRGHRGSIFGRDGATQQAAVLAMNSDTYHITLEPQRLRAHTTSPQQTERQARALADVLQMTAEEVLRLMRSERTFLYLKKNAPAWAAEHIAYLAIPGVNREYHSKRFYPDGETFAHIIGYTDWRGVGRLGIESAAHKKLDAVDGELRYVKATDAAPQLQQRAAVPGDNVYLTLDRRLQYAAYRALAAAVQRHGAQSAALMLMDVHSGDILALANYPSFNPNHIRREDMARQINHALADQVEPASTVKPFVVALALEHGITTPQEIFPTKKALRRGKLRVFDKHIREDLDTGGIVRKSSNVGAVLLAERIGKQDLEQFYRALGFSAGKVLGLRAEAHGILRDSRHWRKTDFTTHSYGYGFSLTLPQLLRAYSVFATDGFLVTPRLWRDADTAPPKRVLSAQTARTVRAMMEGVVSPDGTARRAAVPGYRIAGKTGTAGKWIDGEFDLSKRRVFFVGMAPASAPRYLAVVMVDEPTQQGDSGGAVAAPVFSQLMQEVLLFGGVRPDALAAL